jgi:hypothetical protein
MKLNKSILGILTISGTLALGGIVGAQEKKDEKPATPPPVAPPTLPAQRDITAGLARYLNLSDEQRAKVKPLLEKETADIKALREDKSVAREAQMAKIKEIRDGTTAKVKPLLNDEQAQKWERIRNPRVNPPRAAAPGAVPQPPAGSPPPAAPKAPPAK